MVSGGLRSTSWKKGHARLAGRTRGTINRNNKLLKDALLIAGAVTADRFVVREIIESSKAEALDQDGQRIAGELEECVEEHGALIGFLSWMAEHHTASYATLLGKVLPTQIRVDSHKDITYRSVADIERDIRSLSAPLRRIAPLLMEAARKQDTTTVEFEEVKSQPSDKQSDERSDEQSGAGRFDDGKVDHGRGD